MDTLKILIVEDDFSSRFLLQKILEEHGTCHIAVNGKEAVEAVKNAMDDGDPYDLICLDIMMPEMDGHDALEEIRQLEEEKGIFSSEGVKIIMTTALEDMKNIKHAYQNLCDGYLAKPITKGKLLKNLYSLNIIS
jgi:two-component system chemotaxis response regulator CheY